MNNTKGIYRFKAWCRQGDLEGLFVATRSDIENLLNLGKDIEFGEVLGKYSDISFTVREEHITLISEESTHVDFFENFIVDSGINPLLYIEDDYDEDDEE